MNDFGLWEALYGARLARTEGTIPGDVRLRVTGETDGWLHLRGCTRFEYEIPACPAMIYTLEEMHALPRHMQPLIGAATAEGDTLRVDCAGGILRLRYETAEHG